MKRQIVEIDTDLLDKTWKQESTGEGLQFGDVMPGPYSKFLEFMLVTDSTSPQSAIRKFNRQMDIYTVRSATNYKPCKVIEDDDSISRMRVMSTE